MIATESQSPLAPSLQQAQHPAQKQTRVALLSNFLPPYRTPVLACLTARYPNLRIFLSTPMEPNRSWGVDWGGLDVALQKTFTFRSRWRHPQGFAEPLYVHLPLDTLAQLKAFRAEVVLSTEMGFRTLLAAVYRKLHSQSRLLIWADVSERTEQGRGVSRNLLRRFLSRNADAFIVSGDSGARYIRSLHVPASKIFTIPYATDVDRFRFNPPENLNGTVQNRWLYVGQLIERKGLLPFLKVALQWASAHPDQTIEFLLAGEGPLRERLENLNCPANLKLRLLGNVPYGDLPRLYAGCGFFVFPTFADTWGLVVNEALASGVPVLGSVYSQAVEMLVSDGGNGWKFCPDDATQIYAAIERAVMTPADELLRMRACARATANQQSPARVADLLDHAISACLGSAFSNGVRHVF